MIEIDDGESVWVIDDSTELTYEIIQSTHAFVLFYDERPSQQYQAPISLNFSQLLQPKRNRWKAFTRVDGLRISLDKYASKNKRTLMEIGIKLA